MDPNTGNMYMTDVSNCVIRMMTVNAVVTTFAGTGGSCGFANGVGTNAVYFAFPYGIARNPSTSVLYVADQYNNMIRQIVESTSVVTTIAGGGGKTNTGYANGIGTYALFNVPAALAYNPNTNQIYLTDFQNYLVRAISNV